MRKIANILTKNLFNDKIFYNVTDSKDNIIPGLPVLCVGVDFTKRNYPNFDRISMKIDDMTSWTYGPREKRNVYESRLKSFISDAIAKFKSSIRYRYVNVIVDGTTSSDFLCVKDLVCKGNHGVVSFIYNGVVYVYDNEETVYGISIRELSYVGIDTKSFLRNVYKNTTVVTNKDSIPLDVRILFNGSDYLIPCLFSSENE